METRVTPRRRQHSRIAAFESLEKRMVLSGDRVLDSGVLAGFSLDGDVSQMLSEIGTARQAGAAEIQGDLANLYADKANLAGAMAAAQAQLMTDHGGPKQAVQADKARIKFLAGFGKSLSSGSGQLQRDLRSEQSLFNKLDSAVAHEQVSALAVTIHSVKAFASGGMVATLVDQVRALDVKLENLYNQLSATAQQFMMSRGMMAAKLSVSQSSFRFSVDQGSASLQDGQFNIESSGSSPIAVSISTGGDFPISILGGQSLTVPTQGSSQVNFDADPAGLASGTYTGTITITDTSVPADQVTMTITLVVSPPVSHQSDVAVAIVPSLTSVQVGQQITYSVTASNLGPHDAQDIDLMATLPGGMTITSASSTSGQASVGDTSPSVGGGTVSVFLVPLTVGSTITLTIICTANDAGSNVASFSVPVAADVFLSDPNGTDPNMNNNSTSVNVLITNPTGF